MPIRDFDTTAWTKAEKIVEAMAAKKPDLWDDEALRSWVLQFLGKVVSMFIDIQD